MSAKVLLAVVSEEGMVALQRYFDHGGHFIGVHSAACTMMDSECFVKQVGASFDYHPDFCRAIVHVLDAGKTHPSTSMLPERWEVEDEMYAPSSP
jgi:hypothetical protein